MEWVVRRNKMLM